MFILNNQYLLIANEIKQNELFENCLSKVVINVAYDLQKELENNITTYHALLNDKIEIINNDTNILFKIFSAEYIVQKGILFSSFLDYKNRNIEDIYILLEDILLESLYNQVKSHYNNK